MLLFLLACNPYVADCKAACDLVYGTCYEPVGGKLPNGDDPDAGNAAAWDACTAWCEDEAAGDEKTADEWSACILGYEDEITEYEQPDEEACAEAKSECGAVP